MPSQPLLALYAHPDDESFGSGGTLAHYAAQGVPVTLVCATRGEVGEISDPELATPETLPQVRENELRCAASALGLSELIFLDYRDSGTVGSELNKDPRAFIHVSADVVVPRLVDIIRRLRPQAIMTFEPYGGYGHPDHIAIHKHTVAAFYAAADPLLYPELGRAWQVPRLFYSVIPRSFFRTMVKLLQEVGVDPGGFGAVERSEQGWPDERVNVVLDVSDQVEKKWRALQCHRTQFGQNNPFRQVPEQAMKQMMSREHFALAWPEVPPDTQFTDLLGD